MEKVSYISAEDLGTINDALGRGEDVRIVCVPGGVKIQSQRIRTLRKKAVSETEKEEAGNAAVQRRHISL